jgi:hypothetical protein
LFVFIRRTSIAAKFFLSEFSIASDRSVRNPGVVNGNSRNLRDLAIEVLCKNTRFKREFRAGGGGSQGRKPVRRLRGNLSKKRQV